MTRKERDELCALSLESFGTKYAWQSYLKSPYYVTEMVATSDGKMRQVKVAKWRTLDEVIVLMKGKPIEPDILPESQETIPKVELTE